MFPSCGNERVKSASLGLLVGPREVAAAVAASPAPLRILLLAAIKASSYFLVGLYRCSFRPCGSWSKNSSLDEDLWVRGAALPMSDLPAVLFDVVLLDLHPPTARIRVPGGASPALGAAQAPAERRCLAWKNA